MLGVMQLDRNLILDTWQPVSLLTMLFSGMLPERVSGPDDCPGIKVWCPYMIGLQSR